MTFGLSNDALKDRPIVIGATFRLDQAAFRIGACDIRGGHVVYRCPLLDGKLDPLVKEFCVDGALEVEEPALKAILRMQLP